VGGTCGDNVGEEETYMYRLLVGKTEGLETTRKTKM
jgi:hypothetical protein